MKLQLSKSLIIISFVLLINSCKNNPTEPSQYAAPPQYDVNGTMPLSINNYWTYVDSNMERDNILITSKTTETITNFSRGDGMDWWTLSYDDGTELYFSNVADFIYMKSGKIGIPNQEIEYIPPEEIKDTLLFYQAIPYNETPTRVKVYLYKGEFKTPAGTFDSVYVYDSYELENRTIKYFKPKLGLLETDIYSYQDSSKIIYKSILTSYSLNK